MSAPVIPAAGYHRNFGRDREANPQVGHSVPEDVNPQIIVIEQPEDRHRHELARALMACHHEVAGPSGHSQIAITISDPDTRKTLGGLWGTIYYGWLYIELLVVPERFRSRLIGSEVLARAEQIAIERGCVGVWLSSYSFQSPDFYRGLGYRAFGMIDDHPAELQRVFFKKRLEIEATGSGASAP